MPICTKCRTDKPQEDFFWERRRSRYTAECKACRNARVTVWARANRERVNETRHRSYARKIGKDPEECRGKRFTPEELVIRERERGRKRYRENPEVYSRRARQWYAENKDHASKRNAEWARRNRDKLRAWSKRKYREDPAKAVAKLAQRKARKMRAQPPWLSAIQKAQILEMYDLAKAKSMQTGVTHDVDHIFPLINGKFCGLHVPWNLQVITNVLNRKKSTFFPAQFAHLAWDGTPIR